MVSQVLRDHILTTGMMYIDLSYTLSVATNGLFSNARTVHALILPLSIVNVNILWIRHEQ